MPTPQPGTVRAPSLLRQEREYRASFGAVAQETVLLAARVYGAIDASAGCAVLDRIVDAHEVLRTRLVERDGDVIQEIHPSAGVRTALIDVASGPHRARALARALLESIEEPFVISQLPMVRPIVVRLGRADLILALVLPHTVTDGASRAAFHNEVGMRVRGAWAAARTPSMQVRDLARWDRLTDHSAAVEHWAGELAHLDSRALRPATGDGLGREGYLQQWWDAALLGSDAVERLRLVAHSYRVSPALVSVAALCAVIHARVGARCVVVGLFHHNRWTPAERPLIGPLYDVVPLRVDLSPSLTLGEIAQQAQRRLEASKAHRLPWALARSLLDGPCDFAVNFYRDVPQSPIELQTPPGRVVVVEYRPTHRRVVAFPVAAPWWDSHVIVDVRPSAAGLQVGACGGARALRAADASGVATELADLLRRIGVRHDRTLKSITAGHG